MLRNKNIMVFKMSKPEDKEAVIVKFPGIASISLSITPIGEFENFDMLEAVVKVYDENDEQIMRQKARSLFTIAKNLKLFIQNRTNLPINDRRMSVWFADYLGKINITLDEEEAYQIIKKVSQALERISRVAIEHVEPSDLVSIETDVLAKLIAITSDRLLSEDELYDLLEKHQTPISNTVNRKISYKNSGGVDHKDKIKLEITPSEKILEHKLVASFKNETEKELKNIIISDIIPYNYKIIDVQCKKGGKYKKELLEDGLKVTWKITKVPSGEDIKAFYTLEKRIPRTIMVRKSEEIRIVQDYNSLLREEDEDGKIAIYFVSEAINLLPVTLDELIVRDLIPTETCISDKSVTEEMSFVDFGQKYGINAQQVQTNVETGTKFLQKYKIDLSALVWKIDFKVPMGEDILDDVYVTKIIEPTVKENTYICTLAVSTPVSCTLVNEIESGLDATEYLPSELAPRDSKKMSWDVADKLSVSMILKGNLNRQPTAPKITVEGKEHSAKLSEVGFVRKSQVISLPFTHVALYRRIQR